MNGQDWDEIEALRASLREHMAEIHRLRAAGRQALEALCLPCDRWNRRQTEIINASITTLRDALAEEKNENTVQSTGGVHSWVSDGANRGVEAVTDCHEKAADHIPDATKMMASVREHRTVGATIKDSLTVEPVGYGVFEDGNLHDSFRLEHEATLFAALKGEHAEVGALYRSPPTSQESRQVEPVAWLFQHEETGLTECVDVQQVEWGFERNNPLWQKIGPLYAAPPKRKPLTDEQIQECVGKVDDARLSGPITEFARAIERAIWEKNGG